MLYLILLTAIPFIGEKTIKQHEDMENEGDLELEPLENSNHSLLNILQESITTTDQSANDDGSFTRFQLLHDNQNFHSDEFVLLAESLQSNFFRNKKLIAKTALTLEERYHNMNTLEAQKCIKSILGTNSKSETFFQLLDDDETSIWKLYYSVTQKVKSSWMFHPSMFVLRVGIFYADVIKDVALIIKLKDNLNMEEPIAKKLIILLSASLLIPEFLNAILQFSSNPFMVSKRKRLCLVLLSPFTPAVCIYMKGRFAMKKTHLLARCRLENGSLEIQDKLRIDFYDKERTKWNKLFAKIRSNENVFEHFIQSLVLIIFATLEFTTTHTMTKGKDIQNLMTDKNNIFFFISAVWSFCSITRGHLYWYTVKKDDYIPMKGFLLLLSFLALTLIARLAAVYFYFAPSMGFFNLLSHKKFGQMMFRDGIDSANWTHVDSYKAMTGLSSTSYSVILICSVIVHYFLVLFIMIRFAGKMKPFRERISEKFFHLSTQLLCPSNYKDWDEIEEEEFETNWRNVSNEMKALLVLFTLENILLCLPMFILTKSIVTRNRVLVEGGFKLMQEEVDATVLAFSLSFILSIVFAILPFIQYKLYTWYHTSGHPWSNIFNLERKKMKSQTNGRLHEEDTLNISNQN